MMKYLSIAFLISCLSVPSLALLRGRNKRELSPYYPCRGRYCCPPWDPWCHPHPLPPPRPPPPPQPAPAVGLLTAADVDDNLNFEWFLKYKQRVVDESGTYPNPFLDDRVAVEIYDGAGTPFSCAELEVDGKVFPAGADGKLNLFPTLDELPRPPWQVEVRGPGGTCPCVSKTISDPDSADRLLLEVAEQTSSLPTGLDLALLVDTTGSMCDEINYLITELGPILTNSTKGLSVDVNLAYIAYKAPGDSPYDIRVSPFGSTPTLQAELDTERCSGGGTGELVHEALEKAAQLEWRPGNVAKVAIIVGDEPPHGNLQEYMQRAFNASLDLREQGVHVYGLAASGANDALQWLFRLVSFMTHGRYLWLTDDSGVGLAHAEPKVLCYHVTALNKLLYRILRADLTGTRVEAEPGDIVRKVGEFEGPGVCVFDLTGANNGVPTSHGTRSGGGPPQASPGGGGGGAARGPHYARGPAPPAPRKGRTPPKPTQPCPPGTVYNPVTGDCECRVGTWDPVKGYCVGTKVPPKPTRPCPPGTVYNPVTGDCECRVGTWDPVKGYCVGTKVPPKPTRPCPPGTVYYPVTGDCECRVGTWDPVKGYCVGT